jgi:hypothetical protein
MNQLLKLKTWQVFIILMSPRLLSLFFLKNPFYLNLILSLNPILYFGFFMLSYEFLRQFKKEAQTAQRIMFHLLNIAFILIFGSTIFYGYKLDFIETILVMPLYLAAIVYILYVLGKKLNQAEKAYNLRSQSTFVSMLFFLLLPIGVWILIPQFKKLKEV